MIRSFGDKRTEVLFRDERVRQFEGIARAAKRKLEALDAASRLENLTVPRSNRLEKLKGDLKDVHWSAFDELQSVGQRLITIPGMRTYLHLCLGIPARRAVG